MDIQFSSIQQKRYVIVEFIDEDDLVDIVAGKWLFQIEDKTYTYWPDDKKKTLYIL